MESNCRSIQRLEGRVKEKKRFKEASTPALRLKTHCKAVALRSPQARRESSRNMSSRNALGKAPLEKFTS
jgi:hypothetical protein